ncbi:hypothetical protein DSM101010T_14790 [Desulfovibrio subterraneus]|uniref:Uncharacterized protein n=1 Tax=Desulfovibrio subterraneus TaxID=2718620 RepID=A0A7J0BJ55_9BACT|nr:hypothetical protein DSM101010T_14790 [Desulfovibrio subterraneus]
MELGAFRNRNTVRKRYDRKETARSAQVVRLQGMNRAAVRPDATMRTSTTI